ncbi:DUF362 domain-containing protein [candidate division WOR-3 bacterium]|nr:DUF362 domain-containing protein [candidate division WOR-3 bacterium]
MNPATVYFVPPDRATEGVGAILEASGYFKRLRPKKRIGLKVHFGEQGNRNHLRPEFVRAAAIAASYYNLQPVVIETTALYRGRRQVASEHLKLAHEHGFTIENVLAPIEILDGRHGERSYRVPLDSTLVPTARLAHGLRRIRYLINLAHFKGHMVAGFGGAIKNLAMGLAAKAGKLEMHSQSRPWIDAEKCASCGDCVDYCPSNAINFVHYVAQIGPGCTGCGGCLAVCKQNAIRFDWDAGAEMVQRKMVEYARAVLLDREAIHLNFCLNITPNCDCNTVTEKPVMPDVGLFGSLDPVACEQAAWDRVEPKLRAVWPQLKPELLLDAAERLGLGSREYAIVNL